MTSYQSLVAEQRQFFDSGETLSLTFRLGNLRKLKEAIQKREKGIEEALYADMKKPRFEAYLSEISFLYDEIDYVEKHLEKWMRPQKVKTPLVQKRGKSFVVAEPLGTTLIIGPWNYPFQLVLAPLVGSMAAGNTAVLKPSEFAPKTSAILCEIVEATFPRKYIAVEEGGAEVSQGLLSEKWDLIFFTGGGRIGSLILEKAAKHLTPVILELGGKSPAIIDKEADWNIAIRRILWGKFFNAGQTCVAPDYVLLPKGFQAKFFEESKKVLREFFGENPEDSPDYARVINANHFKRLEGLLDSDKVVIGGGRKERELYFSPTIMGNVSASDKVMADEIFGPILPVVEYDDIAQMIRFVKDRPKPLALYLFSTNPDVQSEVLRRLSFGGGCINDCLVHLANPRLPFGGVGPSGMGNYHGKYSFEAFSHRKSVVNRSSWPDPALRYPPYKDKLKWIRKLL